MSIVVLPWSCRPSIANSNLVFAALLTRLVEATVSSISGCELIVHRIMMQTSPSDEELLSALETYTSHLSTTTKAQTTREKAVKGTLQRYENAGSGMKQIAAMYAKVFKEVEDVKSEIERLERKQ